MRKTRFARSVRSTGLFALLLTSPAVLSLQGCTDLTESPFSVITPDNFYRTEEEILAGLASVYSSLRGSLWGYYNLSEISTDEMIVPTRGGDWFDNRRWLEIHYQDWTATSPSALDDMNGTWNDMFTGIARANVILSVLPGIPLANRDQLVAEVRALRAFYYYVLMDLFGGVPVVTDTEIVPRPKNTRAEVFAFIEKELLEAGEDLPESWPASLHGRMTKGAADAMLASLYLNAGVFSRDEGISISDYNSCQGVQVQFPGAQNACAAALAVADRILNSGQYGLSADYHANFRHDNHLSRENIFVVKNLNESGLGFEMLYRPIHYNSGIGGGWNCFATLAETYYNYDTLAVETIRLQRVSIHAGPFMDELRLLRSGDTRHNIFYAGYHFNLETGDTAYFRNSPIPLTFSPHFPFGETLAGEGDGVRLLKWPPDPNRVGTHHSNDYAYFRLAEIYLIKAEAQAVLGQDGAALAAVNTVRDRVFPTRPEKRLAGLSGVALRDAILRERHMELAGEAKRRQDLIRAGRFNRPWTLKCSPRVDGTMAPGLCNDARTVLFPIPQTQINANPLLVQNPGY
jgi:starch-binding outer membrane protein, SusD/RagB family